MEHFLEQFKIAMNIQEIFLLFAHSQFAHNSLLQALKFSDKIGRFNFLTQNFVGYPLGQMRVISETGRWEMRTLQNLFDGFPEGNTRFFRRQKQLVKLFDQIRGDSVLFENFFQRLPIHP